jgi:ferredoxin
MQMTMDVEVDQEKCVASGACVMEAPEGFDQDDDGIVVVLKEHPSGSDLDGAKRAAALCPAAVIRLTSGSVAAL